MAHQTRGTLALLALALLALTLLAPSCGALQPARPQQRAPASATAGEGQLLAGIYSGRWNAADEIDEVAAWTGKRVTFGGTFHNIKESAPPNWAGNTAWILEQVWLGRTTPFANVGVDNSAKNIAAGHEDAAIEAWALEVKAWLDQGGNRSLIIAPLPEMNGDWVPYGTDPTNARLAHRRFVEIFRSLGMSETQVRWAFPVNGWSAPPFAIADYYPGDAWVDVIGFSAYNWGDTNGASWTSVSQTYGPVVQELRATVSATKPYLIAQTGTSSTGGDKDAWLRQMFLFAAADPNVVGLVYFNIDKETDWAVWDGTSGSAGFKDGMALTSTRYQWPLGEWFRPGPLSLDGLSAPTAPAPAPLCPAGRTCDSVAFVDEDARWHLHHRLTPDSPVTAFLYGNSGDIPLTGDWNCDGVRTPAMYRPSNGFMYLRNSNTQGIADVAYYYGDPADIPIAGDFDGDGCDSLAIYRPSSGKVYIKNSLGSGVADHEFYFGNPGDKPFTGDFDGDGVDTIGLHRESTGFVYFRNSNTQGPAELEFYYGDPGDIILSGDWNGDGVDTVAVYRPSNGMLYVKTTNSQGNADLSLHVGSYKAALRISRVH